MSCDLLTFNIAQEAEGSPNVFVRKDWINILDNQNGNYSSNQSVIETSSLSNSNKFMNYREAYLSVPLVLTLTETAVNGKLNPATAETSIDTAITMKSWWGIWFTRHAERPRRVACNSFWQHRPWAINRCRRHRQNRQLESSPQTTSCSY